MSSLLEKLYIEMYEPKLMPQDLLANLELDNYHSVNFNRENDYLVAITSCDLPNGELGKFEYYFIENKLHMLVQIHANGVETTLYDRNSEILRLRNEIKEKELNDQQLWKRNITTSA